MLPCGGLLRPSAPALPQLGCAGEEGGRAVCLTMIVAPDVEEEGRQLIAKYGWQPVSGRLGVRMWGSVLDRLCYIGR